MERKIVEFYEQQHMPDACAERIEERIQNAGQKKQRHYIWKPVMACAVVMLLIVCGSPQIVMGLEQFVQNMIKKEAVDENGQKVTYELEDGSWKVEQGTDVDGRSYSSGLYLTGTVPQWLKSQENRLYFSGNGEWIDITELISEEIPFTYVYTDATGIIHYIVVGGCFDPEIGVSGTEPGLGWSEWFFDTATTAGDGSEKGWIGGYNKGRYDSETDDLFGWYVKGKEILGIPFP